MGNPGYVKILSVLAVALSLCGCAKVPTIADAVASEHICVLFDPTYSNGGPVVQGLETQDYLISSDDGMSVRLTARARKAIQRHSWITITDEISTQYCVSIGSLKEANVPQLDTTSRYVDVSAQFVPNALGNAMVQAGLGQNDSSSEFETFQDFNDNGYVVVLPHSSRGYLQDDELNDVYVRPGLPFEVRVYTHNGTPALYVTEQQARQCGSSSKCIDSVLRANQSIIGWPTPKPWGKL